MAMESKFRYRSTSNYKGFKFSRLLEKNVQQKFLQISTFAYKHLEQLTTPTIEHVQDLRNTFFHV